MVILRNIDYLSTFLFLRILSYSSDCFILSPNSRSVGVTLDSIIFLSFKKYDIRILSERITCTTSNHKRQETQRFILEETIKEKSRNFLRDRMSTNGNIKNQRQKDDLQQLFSLSLEQDSSLSPMRYIWVSVCLK